MRNVIVGRRLLRGTLALAGLGAALSIFVACGGSNARPATTPVVKAPAAASGKTANGVNPNLPGLTPDKLQAGISKAQQARLSAQKGQTAQSTDDSQGVQSVRASDSEILGVWHSITGNLLNGDVSSDLGVTVTFKADGTWTVQDSSGTFVGTYHALGGHEYAMNDAQGSGQAGIYVAGNYLFVANNDGVVIYQR